MKAKRGLTIRYKHGPRYDFVPYSRTALVIWKDQFGTLHVAGWGELDPEKPKVEKAVRRLIVDRRLNKIIEP